MFHNALSYAVILPYKPTRIFCFNFLWSFPVAPRIFWLERGRPAKQHQPKRRRVQRDDNQFGIANRVLPHSSEAVADAKPSGLGRRGQPTSSSWYANKFWPLKSTSIDLFVAFDTGHSGESSLDIPLIGIGARPGAKSPAVSDSGLLSMSRDRGTTGSGPGSERSVTPTKRNRFLLKRQDCLGNEGELDLSISGTTPTIVRSSPNSPLMIGGIPSPYASLGSPPPAHDNPPESLSPAVTSVSSSGGPMLTKQRSAPSSLSLEIAEAAAAAIASATAHQPEVAPQQQLGSPPMQTSPYYGSSPQLEATPPPPTQHGGLPPQLTGSHKGPVPEVRVIPDANMPPVDPLSTLDMAVPPPPPLGSNPLSIRDIGLLHPNFR